MKRLAIYAGTFDPLTLGHLDLVERAAELFDQVLLAVSSESLKDTLFSVEERLVMVGEVVNGFDNVQVDSFTGLLVDYAKEKDCRVLIRGLRAYSDFEYEFQMALTNRKLYPDIETLFMMPKENHSYISSSTVKEVAMYSGNVSDFVPPAVERALKERFSG